MAHVPLAAISSWAGSLIQNPQPSMLVLESISFRALKVGAWLGFTGFHSAGSQCPGLRRVACLSLAFPGRAAEARTDAPRNRLHQRPTT